MSIDARVRELLRLIHETNGTPEQVCRDCPEMLDEVQKRWAELRALDAGLDEVFSSATDADGAKPGRPDATALDFPGYEVVEPLGSGGMGVVYKARELSSGRLVALKVVHPHLRRLPRFVERLTREARIGQRVTHQNVVQTLGLATHSTRAVSRQALVTEYVEGLTLRALLDEMREVPEQLCRHIGHEIAMGLAAIHAIDAVHRDLKLENVLITRDNVVKVMDLGVAKLFEAEGGTSHTDAFVGSLRYAAPEQIRHSGGALDGRADLYALGLTLYELSTGKYAFHSDERRSSPPSRVGSDPRRAGELNPQLSPLFEELLATLLEIDRDRRFASAKEVAAVLELGEGSVWWGNRSKAIRGATRKPPRRMQLPRETALHGREAELNRMNDGFGRASRGSGEVILVEGEAGVGKTRLIDEFAAMLERQGPDTYFIHGGYAPGGAATASGAFSSAYREFFGEEDLEPTLRRHLSESPALVPAFSALLRSAPPPDGTDALTNDALQSAFARTTQSLARERSTVVVIEDLHLAPREGLALFAALAHAVPGHRVLLVGTARWSLDRQWAGDLRRLPHVSGLTVPRLEGHALTALVADALQSPQVAEELSPRIAEKSDGNPYFVFEILRELREGRLLTRSPSGAWVTTQVVREIRSPSSITDLIAARMAILLPEERESIEVAACCGFEFDPLLVGEVLGLSRLPFLRRLGSLESKHRLVRSAGRNYVFDHHQVQEVLYAGLSRSHRERYHAAIAASLESRCGGAHRDPMGLDGGLCASLARHFLDGAEGRGALRYLHAALCHLEKGSRNEAAARLLEQALAIPGLIEGAQRSELLLRLSRCFERSGNLLEETRVLQEANALADAVGHSAQRAQARLAYGVNLSRAVRYDDALDVLAESLKFYRESGDLRGEAQAATAMCSALTFVARYDEAAGHGSRAVELTREVGDRKCEAGAIHHMGVLFLMQGRIDEARGHLERSAVLFREVGEARRAGANLGNVLWIAGRLAEAREQYSEHLERCRECGDRLGEARASANLAAILRSLGHCAEAKAHGDRGLALARECASRTDEALAAANQGAILATLGRNDEAHRLLDRALEAAQDVGHRVIEVVALGLLGQYHLNVGRVAEAREVHERQLELARKIGDRGYESGALACLSAVDVEEGCFDDAISRLDAAVEGARLAGFTPALLFAAAQRACLPGGDPGVAASLLDDLGERADCGMAMHSRWLLWRATKDPRHLAEAGRLLDFQVAHAPSDCRTSMIEGVRLHRDIRMAVAAQRRE